MVSLISIALAFVLATATPAAAGYDSAAAAYRDGEYERARIEFLPLAEAGDQRAQLVLALIFHQGHGIDVNYAEALKWYRKAADQGNMTAQNNLGVMYRRGEGIQRNPKQAFSLLWAAAIQGHSRAGLNVSDMYEKGEGTSRNLVMAYVWLEFAVTDLPKSGKSVANSRRGELAAKLQVDDVVRAEFMAKALRKVSGAKP